LFSGVAAAGGRAPQQRGADPMAGEAYDLELRNVTKRFGPVAAVHRVSLRVRRGEFLSLLGPSGCGKTTTLRLIAGFEEPSEGEILLQGRSVAKVPPNRRDVNTVFQHYALFPHMTVLQNIAYPLAIRRRPRQEIRQRVAEVTDIVDLKGFEARYPHQLSGGQQQRVALARALVNRPAVLLLDEPLGALDLQVRKRMQMELKRIQRNVGITFVYVTHDQEEALTLSDRIAVIDQGAIEQLGSPTDVYDHPASRFVLEFVGSSNILEGTVVEAGAAGVVVRTAEGMLIQSLARQGLEKGHKVMVGVRPEKVVILDQAAKDNSFRGVIEESIFQGSLWHHRIRLECGAEVMVYRQSLQADTRSPACTPGETVWIAWPKVSSIVFSA
jgi:spermidine/putrescine transport system ATP-binding protein